MTFKAIIVFLVTYGFLSSEAAVIKRSSKFDFPANLIGLNDTAEEWLEPYSKTYDLVDLGKDMLDGYAPWHIRQALANATISDDPLANQYTDHAGTTRIREAIAKMYSPLIGHELDPEDNIIVTEGATEALHIAFTGHTSPGDEWIVIEPTYLKYVPMIKMAWGVPRFTSLKLVKKNGTIDGDDWILDKEEMESLFNEKTKGIILNNPLNPLGKVYKREELEFIANLANKYDTIVICDEAHEWVTHKPHVRIAALPGMFNRTLTIGTASKAFSVAGFRIGWVYGHSNILRHLLVAHKSSVCCAAAPQQYAIAYAFEEEQRNLGTPNSFFASHAQSVKRERDMMTEILAEAGIIPIVADGGFCMLGNWSPLKKKIPNLRTSMDFITWMIENVGVLGWPLTMFYGEEHQHLAEDYVRFCFHKKIETLLEAARRLKKLKEL